MPKDRLNNVPNVFGCVAKLAAGDAGAEAEVTDTDGVVLEGIGKVIGAFSHGTDEDAHALPRAQIGNVIFDSDNVGVKTQGYFAAVRGQMIGDWVLDDLEQFLLRICGAYGESME